eukprot:scaffold148861_cov28-Tisochrysis_lutea.AAC.9
MFELRPTTALYAYLNSRIGPLSKLTYQWPPLSGQPRHDNYPKFSRTRKQKVGMVLVQVQGFCRFTALKVVASTLRNARLLLVVSSSGFLLRLAAIAGGMHYHRHTASWLIEHPYTLTLAPAHQMSSRLRLKA